jgi:protein SCO1/2
MYAICRFRAEAGAVLVALLVCLCVLPVYAHGTVPDSGSSDSAEGHAHHHIAVPFARSTANYTVPDVTLVRATDGRRVQLSDELADNRAVVLSFIYTSCTTVCPLTSATLADLQDKLGPSRDQVHFVSISIDPEFDTPARLRDYAQRFGAGPAWQHYTGTLAASLRAQRAFDVYRGDKMNHVPVTLVRQQPGDPWVRLDGFATADQLMAELPMVCNTREKGQDHARR